MSTSRTFGMVVAILLSAPACMVGTAPGSVVPATSPRGARTTITYELGGALTTDSGELVEVRSDGLVVLFENGLTLLSYTALREGRFSGIPGPRRIDGSVDESARTQLARYARYPFGLTGEQLAGLLEALGQERLAEIGS
jgi:hypothetical protein